MNELKLPTMKDLVEADRKIILIINSLLSFCCKNDYSIESINIDFENDIAYAYVSYNINPNYSKQYRRLDCEKGNGNDDYCWV